MESKSQSPKLRTRTYSRVFGNSKKVQRESNSPSRRRGSIQLQLEIQSTQLPPVLSGQAWCIQEMITGKILGSKQESQMMEIASLTKIMTAYVCKLLITQFKIEMDEMVSISPEAAWLGGTTAFLQTGYQISIKDLFYAMLLPSGNDAALTLALFFGYKLLLSKKKSVQPKLNNLNYQIQFVKEMNKTAKKLIMNKTQYNNPHGLSDKGNLSCAEDQGKLGIVFMKDPFLAQVVNTRTYETVILNRNKIPTKFTWTNTNKKLEIEGWKGTKTGNTPNAGPCLQVCYIKENINIIITLLKSKSPDHRWKEVEQLKDWTIQEFQEPLNNLNSFTIKEQPVESQ